MHLENGQKAAEGADFHSKTSPKSPQNAVFSHENTHFRRPAAESAPEDRAKTDARSDPCSAGTSRAWPRFLRGFIVKKRSEIEGF
jgi:hypothetical protein